MKRLILAMAVIAISTATLQAQNKMSAKKTVISIAGNIGIPTSEGYSFAAGGDIQADFGVAEGLAITLSGGYENYSVKSSLLAVAAGILFLYSRVLNFLFQQIYMVMHNWDMALVKAEAVHLHMLQALAITLAQILTPLLSILLSVKAEAL